MFGPVSRSGGHTRVDRATISRALTAAGRVMASFRQRRETLEARLLALYRQIQTDKDAWMAARETAFLLARDLMMQSPFTKQSPTEREETLLQMGAAIEACFAAPTEGEFKITFSLRWQW